MGDFTISLAAARVNAGMTQEDVAKSMQMSKNIIIDIELGRRELKPHEFAYLCDLYKVSKDLIRLPSKSTESLT